MIAITTQGLVPDHDWARQQVRVLAIAHAHGYVGLSAAGALDYLRAIEPPTSADDAVVWTFADEPVRAAHVSLSERRAAVSA
jgi:hypothetical protein